MSLKDVDRLWIPFQFRSYLMGTWNRYFCRKCPYETFVSGGDDVGMAAATSTVRCYDCKEIKDVVTTEEPWLAMDKG